MMIRQRQPFAAVRSLPPGVRARTPELPCLAGNQAMQTLLRAGAIQAKLTVHPQGDSYEQEADRVADALVQRQCACGGECQECRQKGGQRSPFASATRSAPPQVESVLASPGQPLATAVRADLEPRFGRDFSGVRVYTDQRAAESAREIHARAYTSGDRIVFGAGQYAPATTAGRRLLAHELTHVLQQSRAGNFYLQREALAEENEAPQLLAEAKTEDDAEDEGEESAAGESGDSIADLVAQVGPPAGGGTPGVMKSGYSKGKPHGRQKKQEYQCPRGYKNLGRFKLTAYVMAQEKDFPETPKITPCGLKEAYSEAFLLQAGSPPYGVKKEGSGRALNGNFIQHTKDKCFEIKNCGQTKIGTCLDQDRSVAVDPDVIKLRSKLLIEGLTGIRVAEDIGGDIKGAHIDIYYGEISAAEGNKKTFNDRTVCLKTESDPIKKTRIKKTKVKKQKH